MRCMYRKSSHIDSPRDAQLVAVVVVAAVAAFHDDGNEDGNEDVTA
jgi:hypothetical protein